MNSAEEMSYYIEKYGYMPWTITIASMLEAGHGWDNTEIATHLRKAQNEIDRLTDELKKASACELTDEEILKMAADKFHYSEYKLVIDFARATLKKASEK